MDLTFTFPKEIRRQKKGKVTQITYKAFIQVPFELMMKITDQEMRNQRTKKLIKLSMITAFDVIQYKLGKYMKGFDKFSDEYTE